MECVNEKAMMNQSISSLEPAMLLALLGCLFFIVVIFMSDPFPLGQFSVDLSSVSESNEILQLLGLCLSVCTKMLGVKKCWECNIVGSLKMLGGQKSWELKNVGSTKVLEGQN